MNNNSILIILVAVFVIYASRVLDLYKALMWSLLFFGPHSRAILKRWITRCVNWFDDYNFYFTKCYFIKSYRLHYSPRK
jgi:hypothetical protein